MVPGMNKKRTELGAWGRLSKRSTESSSYWGDPQTSADPRIRIIRGGGKDLNQWERIIKRGANGEARLWPIKKSKVLRAYGRLSKRPAGESLVKWGRIKKSEANEDEETNDEAEEDEEDEEFEQDEEEFVDEAEKHGETDEDISDIADFIY